MAKIFGKCSMKYFLLARIKQWIKNYVLGPLVINYTAGWKLEQINMWNVDFILVPTDGAAVLLRSSLCTFAQLLVLLFLRNNHKPTAMKGEVSRHKTQSTITHWDTAWLDINLSFYLSVKRAWCLIASVPQTPVASLISSNL